MWVGLSNPFLGACVLISVLMDNVYIFVFYCTAVCSGIFWCFYLKIEKEKIYNGLYPCQAIYVSIGGEGEVKGIYNGLYPCQAIYVSIGGEREVKGK